MKTLIATLLVSAGLAAGATTPVAIIDTLYNPDGSRANCTLYISNQTFVDNSATTVAANSIQTQVVNGAVSVSLVPTTNAQTLGVFYNVQYSCVNGPPQGSTREYWSVPASGPTTIAVVRVAPFLTVGGINSINSDATRAQTLTRTSDTNVTLTITDNGIGNHNFTVGWSGQLAVSRGGTGASSLTGILKGNTGSPFSSALAADVISLFTSCSGIQYLGADGACHAASGGGGGSVTFIATTSPITGGNITTTGTIACATCGVTGTGLQQFASTTSAQLAGVISDESGSGALVFTVSPNLNLTGSTTFDIPTSAGATATSSKNLALDSTSKNLHGYANNADAILAAFASAPTTGNCVQSSVSGGTVLLVDSGAVCGGGSGTTHQAALDCAITYTDAQHLSLFPAASSTNFCSFGNNNGLVTKFTGAITITQSGSVNPNLLIWISDGSDGQTPGTAVICNAAGSGIAISGAGSALVNSCSAYPVSGGIIRHSSWASAVAGSFDATGTLYRPLMNAGAQLLAGPNITIAQATTGTTIGLSGVVPVVNGGTNNSSPAFAALTDGATVTWAIGSALVAAADLTFTTHGGSRTLNITGPVSGGSYMLWIKQDGTGGEGLTLGTGCTWKVSNGGGGGVTPSVGANAIDFLAFTYDGTNCYANFNKNFN